MPTRTDVPDRLSALDKARVAEFYQLQRTFGDSLWNGWSHSAIPILLYNESYALPGSGLAHRTSIRIGDSWAASMTTRTWTSVKMGNDIRDGLPPVIKDLIPYRVIAHIFLGLAMNTDAYICAIGHEGFHAYQGMVDPDRLARAEEILPRSGNHYPWNDSSFDRAWGAELNALADALVAKDEAVTTRLAERFLFLRKTRRHSIDLDASLVELGQLREWEEGLGKYTELALWKRAADDPAYHPVKALQNDPDFRGYQQFDRQWTQELSTLRFQSHADETRFYYSGMAQAFLLDRLAPGWRNKVLWQHFPLEDLLRQSIMR